MLHPLSGKKPCMAFFVWLVSPFGTPLRQKNEGICQKLHSQIVHKISMEVKVILSFYSKIGWQHNIETT